MTSFAKNFVIDFAAPTNGTSDCSAAGASLAAFCAGMSAGDDLTLTGPAHVYKFDKGDGSTGVTLFKGVLGGITVVVNMPGATFTAGASPASTGYFLANGGMYEDNTHSARIASVNPGATSVTLQTLAEHSRFSVGQWMMVAGIDLQGQGSPINPAFFEYRKITAKNTGTGVVSFTEPLQNRYLSTWPLYNPGDASHHDYGGPATIFAMPPEWDLDLTINGGTFSQDNAQTVAKCRRITLNIEAMTSLAGIIPTVNQSFSMSGADQSACIVEVDKCVEELNYSGGSINQIGFQSMSCATRGAISGMAITTLNGTPRNLQLSDNTIGSFQIGVSSFGRTEGIAANNNVISAITHNESFVSDVIGDGYTLSAGVIRAAKSLGPLSWAVPGTDFVFTGTDNNTELGYGRVLNVTEDGTYIYASATLGSSFPVPPSTLRLHVHPCPAWYGSGNTGCADAVSFSQPSAQGQPLYYSRTPLRVPFGLRLRA
jgi:hypothetical protein